MASKNETIGTSGGSDSLLVLLASRVRELRRRRSLTRDELARRSGLSVRFLARIESGEGNISILRLEALARSLGATPDALLRRPDGGGGIVALVGLRGAGKSTVGPLLAERLGRPFIEMDRRIVEASGLSLEQLFELHGEAYYRRIERETLVSILLRGEPAVVAAAGGVVNDAESWGLLCEHTTVVWLRATPEEHWERVIAQGDRRPMAGNPAAMHELRTLLASRERTYAAARLTADTSSRSPRSLADEIARRLTESG